jgi:hypothetical protein
MNADRVIAPANRRISRFIISVEFTANPLRKGSRELGTAWSEFGGKYQRLHYSALLSGGQLPEENSFGSRSLSSREKISPAKLTLIR